MAENVVIVESPAKAKTINKYLGSDFEVLASYGHVRDLPSKDGSVRPDEDFAMSWQVDRSSGKRLNEIARAVQNAETLYLATDPDREGEAISWHVLEVLRKKKALKGLNIKRVAFNEITKSAIREAMSHPRDIDSELVDAYLARRALDYLVGFTLSPVLWRKLPGARSAGRVQSVALRLICEREIEIDRFVPEEYWSIEADFATGSGQTITAKLTVLDGAKLRKKDLRNQGEAAAAKEAIESRDFAIGSVERKPGKRNPAPPFTTSTLQQEASRKLGFNASKTMRTAQVLYEGKSLDGETTGLITYMRTDGVTIAGEAINAARGTIANSYGERYVPEKPRAYKSKSRSAQEAHEAIRPTDPKRTPRAVRSALSEDEYRLYELIWKRTIASQMASADVERTTIDLISDDGKVTLRATGTIIKFDGFLKLYREGRDDEEEEQESRLPDVNEQDPVTRKEVRADQHFTEPLPRFTEASLVRKLEELGIGRPSTYASILSVLRDRNYVRMERKRFIPEDKGRLVTAFLENFFRRYVEYDFTANLEDQLDDISEGKIDWKKVLDDFWEEFKPKTEEVLNVRNAEILERLNEYLGPFIFGDAKDSDDPRKCPACADGRLSLKTGRYGAFIGCSNYPQCRFTRQFTESGENGNGGQIDQPVSLGTDPDSGKEITLRDGRFGPYLQLGDGQSGEKPKRASIPKDMQLSEIDFDRALALIRLPRDIGSHPETGKPIMAGIGRYGPYLNHDGKFTSLQNSDEVFSIGINRAVSLIAEEKAKGRGGPSEIRVLGEHPDDGKSVRVMSGRYGPYVKHGGTNATLPKGIEPETVTLDQALELLKKKQARKGSAKAGKRSKSAKSKGKKSSTKQKSAEESA